MSTRTIIAVFLALIVTIAATAMWSAGTMERDGDTDANVIEDSGAAAGKAGDTKKGNKVVRIVAAPFKALGRLFGHRDHKLERMTDKDSDKFESVGVARVEDQASPERKGIITGSAREHLSAGRQLLQAGRVNEAIAELSTAASMDPRLSEAHNLLGVAFDRKGLGDRAKDSYEKAVKFEPEDAQSLNNLGFSLYQNGNYRAAVDRLKRAAKLEPNDERILNNLGLALCRLGKFEDAYKYFSRAGGAFTGNLNVATMLERLGRDDDAIKYYQAAYRVDPNSTVASRRLIALYQRTGKMTQLAGNDERSAAGSSSSAVAVAR
jgi:Tfp pilus assembly protein PilF